MLKILPANVAPRQQHVARVRAYDPSYVPPPDGFTCDDCSHALKCQWAFDDYNTKGDCLALK